MIISGAKLVTDGKILTGLDVVCENGRIAELRPHQQRQADGIELDGLYLAPGFIDLHCHGAMGYEFIDGTEEAFLRICAAHAAHGTRVLYPTLSACDRDVMLRFLEQARNCKDDCDTLIPGVHLEGPYLAPGMCGAQDTVCIRRPDPEEYVPVLEKYADVIARWSYAPERDDGAFQRALTEKGIVGSFAHTEACYPDVLRAYENGGRLVTHMYSCTSTVTRVGGFRRLGVIESAYLLDGLYAEVIADGCHVPAELMRMIVKIKGPGRVCLVSDAIRYACMEDAEKRTGGSGRIPYLIEDGVAKLADRSAFAGSIASGDTLLRRTVQAGIPLADAVTMLTATPAEVMGLRDLGRIAAGWRALFTVFDGDLRVYPGVTARAEMQN